jgi:RNA polymerase sigma-70 factor (ECF subfamily)
MVVKLPQGAAQGLAGRIVQVWYGAGRPARRSPRRDHPVDVLGPERDLSRTMEEPSDEELMVRIADADARAFEALAARHVERAFGLVFRITRNHADADEIVQEALLRVWVNAPRWRPQAAFRTWLYRVLVNLCHDRRRHAPFAALEAAGDPPDPAPDAITKLQADETARLVASGLDALPERQRIALVLTYYEGLSNAETAAVMATSVSGIEALLVRAKRALRQSLGPLME